MALPDYGKREFGTEVNWKSSGGTGLLTLTSLANAAARQGAKIDLGATWDAEWLVVFESAVGSAATNGAEIQLFFGESLSGTAGTDNPGNLTGADAGLSVPSELIGQLLYVGSLVLSNTLGTGKQVTTMRYRPLSRYVMPVVYNLSAQTLSGTAGNHAVRMIPVREFIQDAA